jgi:predicted dehydrogenase
MAVRIGLIGSKFISSIHARALRRCNRAEIVAVASPTEGHAEQFARQFEIQEHFTDYRQMLASGLDMVVIGAPNDLHCQMTVDAAAAGVHVVVEKPFCLNLAESDRMIDACRQANVKLMYAEELCFAPKYVRLKQLLDGGALGWTFTIYEEEWNYGFPQEMQHFVDCVADDAPPAVTGEDGRAVLEILFAAYQSAGTGRKVELPLFTEAKTPYELWAGA